jgi:methylmalonyl-CoA mutase C-terminal domain/subunit
MEVIYSGLHCPPDVIVSTAMQENVDAVGLSLLSGAHMTLFPKIQQLMKSRGLGDVLLFGGGVIPRDDVTQLKSQGIGEIFPPGSSMQDIVSYLNKTLPMKRDKDKSN